jgi:hypothetical protein
MAQWPSVSVPQRTVRKLPPWQVMIQGWVKLFCKEKAPSGLRGLMLFPYPAHFPLLTKPRLLLCSVLRPTTVLRKQSIRNPIHLQTAMLPVGF